MEHQSSDQKKKKKSNRQTPLNHLPTTEPLSHCSQIDYNLFILMGEIFLKISKAKVIKKGKFFKLSIIN